MSKSQRKYQGVTAFSGMPGSGKTYALAETGLVHLLAGEQVYANKGFDFAVHARNDDGSVKFPNAHVYSSFDDMCDIDSGVILLDEAPLYFNSRKWGEFPDGFFYKLTQIRKDGVRFYYSTIHQAMVDVNIRRVTFFWWECRAITNRWLVRVKLPHEDFREKGAKPLAKKHTWIKPEVCDLYDTLGKVAVAQKAADAIRSVDSIEWAHMKPASSDPDVGSGLLLPGPKAGQGDAPVREPALTVVGSSVLDVDSQ